MIATYLSLHAGTWFLPVLVGAALADSINPCAFSVLFLSIAFLFSLGKNRKYIVTAGGLYIFGVAFVYTMIGVGVLRALSVFSMPNFIGKVGAGLLVAYSIIGLINEFFPAFPLKLKMPDTSHATIAKVISKGTMPASFLLGVLVGLFEFPCTGGPYLFALSLLHGQATFWQGFGYLLVYNVVFVLPLVVVLALATTRGALEKADKFRKMETKKGRVVVNLVLLAVGLLLIMSL